MLISPKVFLYDLPAQQGPLGAGTLALPQLPSNAFGDGTHPSTRLCAGAVDFHCRTKRPARMLDIGTGTGVLARIARARGVAEVVGTDIEEIALQAARKNAALDLGWPPIYFENAPPDSWGPSFNFVVANILEGTLKELALPISRALAPGAALYLSGFTPLQAPSLKVAFERLGLNTESSAVLEGWSLILLRAPQPFESLHS